MQPPNYIQIEGILINQVKLEDKTNVIQIITMHRVILASLETLSQGLPALGVAKDLKEHSHLLRLYYCTDLQENVLTSGKLNLGFRSWRLHLQDVHGNKVFTSGEYSKD